MSSASGPHDPNVGRSSFSLPADTSSPSVARRLTTQALAGHDPHVIEVAQLLVSELVTNAVVHTASTPILGIDITGVDIRIGVQDQSAADPHFLHPLADVPQGRGLHLVDSIAASWGSSATPYGKEVWFRLRD